LWDQLLGNRYAGRSPHARHHGSGGTGEKGERVYED
jgi:hypothetical protein